MHVDFSVVLSELPCCIHTRQLHFEIRLRFDEVTISGLGGPVYG